MHFAAVSSLLVGVFAIGCAGTTELAGHEAEPTAVSAQASASSSPPAHNAQVVARPTHAAPNAAPRGEVQPLDSRWTDEVRAVVATYESWGRVDDEARWAPGLCRLPRAAAAHVSESDDASTHGQKLYTLYAMDPEAYGAMPSAMRMSSPLAGLSQVIVKEAFSPVPVDAEADARLGTSMHGTGAHGLRPAERDGQRFVAGERKGLYLMMKTEGPTEGTDEGWVYATLDADMATVTAVGLIDSCMGCHAEAGDDRLFGLPTVAARPDRGNANAVPL